MRVREVLGVDFCGSRLAVVQVRAEAVSGRGAPRTDASSFRPVLTRWASRTIPPAAESAALAAALRNLLDEEGFTATAAVFGLPRGRGFLQCRPAGQTQAQGFSETDYITDTWTAPDGREVLGVAARADVTRLGEVAAGASLRLLAVELRSMGCVTALGLLSDRPGGAAPTDDGAVLGLIIGDPIVTLALVDRQAVLAVQTRKRPQVATDGDLDTGPRSRSSPTDASKAGRGGEGETSEPALERWTSALSSAEQLFRLMEMAHPDVVPTCVRVIVNEADRQAAKALTGRLGVPVELLSPGRELGLSVEGEDLPAPEAPDRQTSRPVQGPPTAKDRGRGLDLQADYAAAIGLALEGLQQASAPAPRGRKPATARRFNFLQAWQRPRRRWAAPSWRKLGVVAAAIVLLVVAVAGGYAIHKRGQLASLRRRYEALAPRLQKHQEMQARWRALRPWVAPVEDGHRVRNRRVLDEIARLFPPTDQAYVSKMLLDRAAEGDEVGVRLEGRTRGTDVLYEFVSRLNDSELFERGRLGLVNDEPDGTAFAKRFSVTFLLKKRP